jgi:hypothetical protein
MHKKAATLQNPRAKQRRVMMRDFSSGRQKAEIEGGNLVFFGILKQKSEVRSRKSEVRDQRSEIRDLKSQI